MAVYRALVICNSIFPEDPSRFPGLEGPRKDGLILWSSLTNPRTGKFRSEDVEVFYERSSKEIMALAEDFFAKGKTGDTLLFYYSGHGFREQQELFLCGRDSVQNRMVSTAVSADSLNKIMKKTPASTVIVVLDCCHSGAFKGRPQVTPDSLAGKGRYVITASSAIDVAADAESPGTASPFTEALADALEVGTAGLDDSGEVSLDEVFRRMSTRLSGRHSPPRRKFDGSGDLVLARRVRPEREGRRSADPQDRVADPAPAAAPGNPDAERVTLGAHLANLAPRRRKDYSYGDSISGLMYFVLSLVIALLAVGMATNEENLLYQEYEYSDTYSGRLMDPDLFLLYCAVLISLSVLLAVGSLWELLIARKYARTAQSRREFLEMLGRPCVRRVRVGRDAVACLFVVPVFVTLISEDLPILPYSLAISLCGAIVGTVCVSRAGYGDASYLAASLLVLAGVFTPREELGYGTSNDFSGVVIALQVAGFAGMFFVWVFRLSRKRLTLLALTNCLPILVFSIQTGVLPGVSALGVGLALFGCALGDGVALPLGTPVGRLGGGTVGPIRLFRQVVSSR
ncbi:MULTISPECIES: caspase family protein [unclassified Streptomyces]|uniref:caspase family protein n=1 Tax=unclassified Streptomyces TaxID=2593676 RepID=UPI0022537C99|nr:MULTISPECIES: caspase family protein [unclassified Streptomyces]MCX4410800.1 caspase family protein [Streptomyces sp. NBC_01764]MCX5186640.1 caspase family protein [Streptomyces sp. NBC_00268]